MTGRPACRRSASGGRVMPVALMGIGVWRNIGFVEQRGARDFDGMRCSLCNWRVRGFHVRFGNALSNRWEVGGGRWGLLRSFHRIADPSLTEQAAAEDSCTPRSEHVRLSLILFGQSSCHCLCIAKVSPGARRMPSPSPSAVRPATSPHGTPRKLLPPNPPSL